MQNALGGDWTPSEEDLQQVVRLVQRALAKDQSNEERQQLGQEVDALSCRKEFVRYLCFIFAESGSLGATPVQRHMASLMLLKAARVGFRAGVFSPAAISHLQRSVLHELNDSEPLLRKAAAGIVPVIVMCHGLKDWPELIQVLHSTLSCKADKKGAFETAFFVVQQLCDECGEQLADQEMGGEFLNLFVPLLLQLCGHSEARFRAQSLKCINLLMGNVEFLPVVVSNSAEQLLAVYSHLSQDENSCVRKEVCEGLTYLVIHGRFDLIALHIESIAQFMVKSLQEFDEAVLFEACEFWGEICEDSIVAQKAIRPHLDVIVPALLNLTELSEEELSMLAFDEVSQDTSVPDRQETIKPSFHNVERFGTREGQVEENDDEEGDGDEDDEDYYGQLWTLRKSAGSSLNAIALSIDANTMLPTLMPALERKLSDQQNWKSREAAIFVLGSLADVYAEALSPQMSSLAPYLVSQVEHGGTALQVISLWAVGKFALWSADMNGKHQGSGYLQQFVVTLTKATRSRNKKVQHAACSGLSGFVEAAGSDLNGYAKDMVPVLLQAYQMYQVNSKKSMLDTFGEMFHYMPEAMKDAALWQPVLEVLWRDFEQLHPADTFNINFLECFSLMMTSVGTGFGVKARLLYDKCMNWIEEVVTILMTCSDMGFSPENADLDFMYASIEMLSAFVEGLKEQFSQLWEAKSFMQLLVQLVKIQDPTTLQVTFELVGELVQHLGDDLTGIVPRLVDALIVRFREPSNPFEVDMVCNAVWAFGEVTKKFQTAIREKSESAVARLVILLCADTLELKVQVNTAVALGVQAVYMTDLVAGHLEDCGRVWCITTKRMFGNPANSEEEKSFCIQGLFMCIRANPGGIKKHFSYLTLMINSLEDEEMSPDAAQACVTVLSEVKAYLQREGSWKQAYDALNPTIAKELERKQMLQF